MATTRTLINKVLRGLRQFSLIIPDSETSTTDDYLLMILQIINEAKEEIEENGWPFYALRQTVTITLSAGTAEYTLTTSGAADVDTNSRSKLLYETVGIYGGSESASNSDESVPQVWNVTDAAEERLTEVPQERMERMHLTDNNEQNEPTYFAVWNSGSSLKMKVWPTPDATYTLKARIYVPQAELASTDLTTTLSVPERPVYLRALHRANAERGEELGMPGSVLDLAAMDALANAVANEQTKADITVFLER